MILSFGNREKLMHEEALTVNKITSTTLKNTDHIWEVTLQVEGRYSNSSHGLGDR